jgi:rubrerythrin
MKATCVHSCKGLCNALQVAEHREQEAIKEYREYAAQCDYPDVKELLQELISSREQAIQVLRQKREALEVRFAMIDRINDSFA